MGKERTENMGQYKIGGGHLNEFEFNQNKGDIAEEEHQRLTQLEEERSRTQQASGATGDDANAGNEQDELEAEQESAAAMDADVPQPPNADQTTEGQPS